MSDNSLQLIQELRKHSGHENEKYWCPDYWDIIKIAAKLQGIESFTVVIEATAGSYQGDSGALIRDSKNQFYYVQWGWGSCSGCDALQAAEGSDIELAELATDMKRSIMPITGSISAFFKRELKNTYNKCTVRRLFTITKALEPTSMLENVYGLKSDGPND